MVEWGRGGGGGGGGSPYLSGDFGEFLGRKNVLDTIVTIEEDPPHVSLGVVLDPRLETRTG